MTTVLTKPEPNLDEPRTRRPEPGIPFSRLLRVEWGKATDTRAARWLILTVALTTTGLMLAPLLAKNSIDQTETSYLSFAALALTVLLPVVSILTLTSEWSQRTVLATFTQEPRRVRIIKAKVCVSLILAALGTAFAGLITTAAVLFAELSGRDIGSDMSTSRVIGFALFVLLNVLMGVAFGALLHNTAAAIVLFFVLPTAFTAASTALKSIGQWIDPSRTRSNNEVTDRGAPNGSAMTWISSTRWTGCVPRLVAVTERNDDCLVGWRSARGIGQAAVDFGHARS